MKMLFGKKLGMTRVFAESGDSVGVSVVEVDPNTILRVKQESKDGYNAAVVAFGKIRSRLVSKPVAGQFKAAGVDAKRYIREIRADGKIEAEKGKTVTVELFKAGETVHVSGISRGLGFQGAVKRHHFKGGPKTHGQSDRLRAPGSVGASSYPSRTFKGQRMAGHMGDSTVTVKNLRVVAVEPEHNLILIGGPIPGHKNSMVIIRKVR